MMNKNFYGISGFVFEHFIWGIISWLWYKNIYFRCFYEYSYSESIWILLAIVVAVCIVGMIFEMRKDRNDTSVFFNLLLGYGIYTVFTYMQINSGIICIVLLAAGGLSVVYSILVMCRRINNKRKKKKILYIRINKVINTSWRLFGAGMAVIMVVFGVNFLWGSIIMKSTKGIAKHDNIAEQSLSNNIETISLLANESWSTLSTQEKLNVLQAVANVEQQYLGLPNELNVGAANTKGDIRGCYYDNAHEIVIDMDSLLNDSSWVLLDTVCHEAYHSYQHRVVDVLYGTDEKNKNLKLFDKAKYYADEFKNYIEGKDDFDGYYDQNCEHDARKYSESEVENYWKKINLYRETGSLDDIGEKDKVSYIVTGNGNGQVYVTDYNKEIIAGPYLDVEGDLGKVCRYTGLNGLLGYLDEKGKEITPPIYISASEMKDGKALVSEKEGSVYYIDSDGNTIAAGDYEDGYPFEHQGTYARVKLVDGWAIIDSNGRVVFSGADSIEELPLMTELGSAVKDGHAVLFSLDLSSEEKLHIIKEFDQFVGISSVYYGEFAIVKNSSGMYGAVDNEGKVIIQDNYSSIDFEIIDSEEESSDGRYIRFRLQKKNGTYTYENIDI